MGDAVWVSVLSSVWFETEILLGSSWSAQKRVRSESECEVKGEFCTSAKLVRTLHFVGTGVMGMLLLLVAAGSIGSDMNKNVKGTKVHTFTHFVHTSHIHTHTHKFRCAILRWMTPNREQAI